MCTDNKSLSELPFHEVLVKKNQPSKHLFGRKLTFRKYFRKYFLKSQISQNIQVLLNIMHTVWKSKS